MEYEIRSFRHGKLILENDLKYKDTWKKLLKTIDDITDKEIQIAHKSYKTPPKGLARALNKVLKKKIPKNWKRESQIFNDKGYTNKSWKLDFSHETISLEVAFNHGEAIAWNLLKPVIASELNHVEKEIQTDVGSDLCYQGIKDCRRF